LAHFLGSSVLVADFFLKTWPFVNNSRHGNEDIQGRDWHRSINSIVLNERHLNRLLSEYIRYYHEDRTHLGLCKETPGGRLRSVSSGQVIERPKLGGLHHRHDRAA
jgi:hypothetical protein